MEGLRLSPPPFDEKDCGGELTMAEMIRLLSLSPRIVLKYIFRRGMLCVVREAREREQRIDDRNQLRYCDGRER